MLMHCLCTMLVRRLSACLIRRALEFEFLLASTGGLCSPLCGPYARLMHRSDRETARRKQRETKTEGDRGRERETEKETDAQANSDGQTQAQRDSVKQSGPPSLMQTAYAHKPKSAFILLPAAWFLLSGAVFWLMRVYARPTWFEESPYAGLCGNFLLFLFLSLSL